MTVLSESLDRYAALRRGLTAVPVIHGRAAVVTMVSFLPGSLRLLLLDFLPAVAVLLLRLAASLWKGPKGRRAALLVGERSSSSVVRSVLLFGPEDSERSSVLLLPRRRVVREKRRANALPSPAFSASLGDEKEEGCAVAREAPPVVTVERSLNLCSKVACVANNFCSKVVLLSIKL